MAKNDNERSQIKTRFLLKNSQQFEYSLFERNEKQNKLLKIYFHDR
jgi:hypothetical protein